MIRFLPDTFRDAVWRPLAMAAPDGGVYVEIIAPDFRFVFVLALALALAGVLLAQRSQRRLSPPLALLAFTAAAFVPWLATTGNGRYFIPFLLIAGPLCIGLLQLVPVTKGLRLCLAAAMMLWQAYLAYDVEPWRTWNYVSWKEAPAFGVEVPPEVAAQPATYVTLANISYSLIAPRFHPASHWINISGLQGPAKDSPDEWRAQALIATPGPLKLIFPTVPGGQDHDRIDPELGKAIDDLLARQGLSIEDEAQCRILSSEGLARMSARRLTEVPVGPKLVHGFWLCPLARQESPRATKAGPVPERTEQVFDRLEKMCPRIFRPGEVVSLRIPGGALRGYPGSDFKLYVLDDGKVWYKYVRALNPVLVGDATSILGQAFTMDCDNIRGRSGLPWERGIGACRASKPHDPSRRARLNSRPGGPAADVRSLLATMIRFLPDTFRDAIWRPLAIASPEGGVYVEIIAPDFRFAFAVVLVLAWLLLARGNQTRRSPPIILLAFTVLAFVPWLMSTGNGRYFMAFLLIAGPLCIGLVQQLPVSPGLRIFLAAGMVFWQGYLVYDVNPWRNWGLVQWEESPAFGIEVPPDVAAQPATYVTVSSVSFSLIAPRFHPGSRWINISSLQGIADQSVDRLRAQSVIAAAGPLRLIFPTLPGAQDRDRMDPELGKGIDDLLARHSLSIEDEAQCRLMRSSGLAGTASRRTREGAADTVDAQGFWLCPLARHASPRVIPAVPVPQRTEDVFDRLERLCPRIFRPGEVASSRVPGGAVRGYPGSDFKLYVLDQGEVWYKYLRALNPVLLGRVDAILEPAFTMDCNRIPGRSGLPWERGI